MPAYHVGLTLLVDAQDEERAEEIAKSSARTIVRESLYVLEARWDSNFPEEAIEAQIR